MALPNYCVTDFETGGLSSKEHQITEVGMLMCRGDNLKTLGTYHSYVQPYSDKFTITPKALEKSGVSMADISGGAVSKLVVKGMIDFAKEHTIRGFQGKPVIVGHNIVGFDRGFAEEFFAFHGKNVYDYFSTEMIDTLPLARLMWGNAKDDISSFRLEVVCERAEIKVSNAHSALNDARATHKLLQHFSRAMRGGTGATLPIEDEPHTHRPFLM